MSCPKSHSKGALELDIECSSRTRKALGLHREVGEPRCAPTPSAGSFKLVAPACCAEKQAEAGREELPTKLPSSRDGSVLPVAGPLLLGSRWLLVPAMCPW